MVVLNEYVWKATWLNVSAGRFLRCLIRLGLTGAMDMVGSMSLQSVFSRYQIITDAWEKHSCWKTHWCWEMFTDRFD